MFDPNARAAALLVPLAAVVTRTGMGSCKNRELSVSREWRPRFLRMFLS
jgi:hypothetical protein